jgi:hypothetical protein
MTHEFMVLANSGESRVISCPATGVVTLQRTDSRINNEDSVQTGAPSLCRDASDMKTVECVHSQDRASKPGENDFVQDQTEKLSARLSVVLR